MTEKDFRKLVTDLEFTKEDKEEVVVPLNDIKEDIATVEPIDIMDKVLPKKLEVFFVCIIIFNN